ncbi:uncharacterized protein [Epargyreus clarus]|uniref:uncharacterized protein isoform X2 n=1 Tax=Epargyreus clarus TaxID=520877 RepID=UPI003C2D3AA1
MRTLVALFAVAAVCVLARPPVPSAPPTAPPNKALAATDDLPEKTPVPVPGPSGLDDYIMPHFLLAPEPDYDDDSAGVEELYRDIGFLGRLAESITENTGRQGYLDQMLRANQRFPPKQYSNNFQALADELRNNDEPDEPQLVPVRIPDLPYRMEQEVENSETTTLASANDTDDKKAFALTPLDSGYFDSSPPVQPPVLQEKYSYGNSDGTANLLYKNPNEAMEPRHTRQNPNLSRSKSLVASNLDKLRIGLSEESNKSDSTKVPELVHIYDTPSVGNGQSGSIYGFALFAGLGAAIIIAVTGFLLGWYTLSKRAKAAADVDYPAYGVTGPTADLSGDRKLAHSAHMYHYQHQKQQIIAMERNCVDQRNGSVSDPESEEENEEGDYTVYECPGFATTGEMEVKNPLFTEEQTPATPGNCELVKPQPKD